MVSFHTYLFISIHDRTPRILLLSLTHLIMPIDKVITQTIFMVLFTSGSLSHLGEILRCLIWHLTQVFVCYLLSINYILFLQIQHDDQLCLFLQGSDRWGRTSHYYGGTSTPAPHYANFILHP